MHPDDDASRQEDAQITGDRDASTVRQTNQQLGRAGDLVRGWTTGQDVSFRLPAEIWALVFGFLAFRERIAVSHVSRHWRSIALAHPSIWANVFYSNIYRDGCSLACMALSRTGKYPVKLSLFMGCDHAPGLLSCVAAHMDHIRQLYWSEGSDSLPWSLPAPLLSNIRGERLRINSDFLGGQAGSLTEVYIIELFLPAVCPALSTVTALEIHGPGSVEAAENYDQLFALCPRLQYLQISILRGELADILPTGPAPLSLQELELQCCDDDEYDLMRHYLSWKTSGNLAYVGLAQECATPANLAALIGGALELSVSRQYRVERTEIIASGADASWQRSIDFQDVSAAAEHPAHVASLIRSVPDLRKLEIDSIFLNAFLPLLSQWPKLTQLILEVLPDEGYDSYDWTPLRSLSQVRHHSASIVSVVVSVAVYDEPPDHDSTIELLGYLSRCSIGDVIVNGLSHEVVATVELPDQTAAGVRIRFDCTQNAY